LAQELGFAQSQLREIAEKKERRRKRRVERLACKAKLTVTAIDLKTNTITLE
jgi:hypothetical protein